jgi:pimeloyl-ACP methyl ester carboxylesterase
VSSSPESTSTLSINTQHPAQSLQHETPQPLFSLSVQNQSLYPVLLVQLENMSSQPSVVLVPGSFCPGSMYDPLVMPLRAKGYDIHVLEPPCYPAGYNANSSAPQPTMYDDAKFINKYVTALADSGKEVIVLAHSYGGEFWSFNTFFSTREKKKTDANIL